MKVFQKVKSPAAGKVVKILVENESTLNADDVIFELEIPSKK